MPRFGTRSLERLETVDPDLRLIFSRAIQLVDITIICGARSEADQRAAYEAGNSKVIWPNSKHRLCEASAARGSTGLYGKRRAATNTMSGGHV